jgi:hypothetical protein
MKTTLVKKCFRIFPLIAVLALSGCGSPKLSEAQCYELRDAMYEMSIQSTFDAFNEDKKDDEDKEEIDKFSEMEKSFDEGGCEELGVRRRL